jgi:hypothetical protein
MARKTINFELAHKDFKTTQFSAFHSYELLFGEETPYPSEILFDTYVKDTIGEWVRLDSRDAISRLVFHPEGIEPPLTTLLRLIHKVQGISCECMYGWEPIKTPRRFLSGAEKVDSPRGMSMLSTLYIEKLASLHELQEFYSLEDALRMYDDFTVQNINKALQQEKSMADAKSKR